MRPTKATLETYNSKLNDVHSITIEYVRHPETSKEAVFIVLSNDKAEIEALRLTPEDARRLHEELGAALASPRCSHPRGYRDPDDPVTQADTSDRVCASCGGVYNRDTNKHARASSL